MSVAVLCELLFEAQSPQKVIAVFSNRTVNIHSSSLDWYVLGYCITNSDHTSTWVVNISHREQLQTLSDGMSYSIVDPSQWTEKNGPTVRVHLTERVGKISGIFPCQYFPSVCSQQQDLNWSWDRWDSPRQIKLASAKSKATILMEPRYLWNVDTTTVTSFCSEWTGHSDNTNISGRSCKISAKTASL